MRRVLYILSMLSDEDVDWMVSAGEKQEIAANEAIISEGESLNAIFVVIGGSFAVRVGEEQRAVETLGSGEMVGEISLLDSRPPTASVVATEPGTVLRIARSALNAKLAIDPSFAARFYKALATFLAQRLRNSVATLGYGGDLDEELAARDEIDPELLDSISIAGARYNVILDRLRNR